MQGLLPDDLLQELLSTTGAYEGVPSSRLVVTGQFKKYDFQPKKKSEFDIAVFEDIFDLVRNRIEDDWKQEFFPDCRLIRQKAELRDLVKYKFRETSFTCLLTSDAVSEGFPLFFGKSAFFFLLNQYLGGGNMKSAKESEELTDIEIGMFRQILSRIAGYVQSALQQLQPVKFSLGKFPLNEAEQKANLKGEYLLTEIEFTAGGEPQKIALGLPAAFLAFIKERQQDGGEEVSRQDPLWQKVVTQACLDSRIDLDFKIDRMAITFGQSVALKSGDIFPWGKTDNQVSISYKDAVKMRGTIGMIDGNYAVRVEEILSQRS